MILCLHALTNILQLLKLYQWNNLGIAFRGVFMYPKSSRVTNIMVEWKIKERNRMKKGDKIRFNGYQGDDALATAPTLQDLKTTLDMALLLNDIEWAQETYEQIQQMEGEHA